VSGPVLPAVALAAAAAWLAVPCPVAANRSRSQTRRPPEPVTATALAAVSVAAALLVLDGHHLALALIVLGVAAAALRMWRRSRGLREVARRRTAVVEVGEAVVGELAAGVPPVTALTRAVGVWPELRPVAAAARLDADVPQALRSLAALPGAEGLAELASAWQVSQRSGGTLARALSQVVESSRARQAAAHLVRSELASAQATARLVAVLPLGTLAMAAGVGAAPWSFLLGTTAGLVCLGSGAALVLAGLAWIDRIAARATAP
jgi:tight adherence protein B